MPDSAEIPVIVVEWEFKIGLSAMSRFYFHVVCESQLIEDKIGVELYGQDPIFEIGSALTEVLKEDEWCNMPLAAHEFIIVDENAEALFTVAFPGGRVIQAIPEERSVALH